MTPTRRAFVITLVGVASAILTRLTLRQLVGAANGATAFHALGLAYLAAGGSRRRAAAFLSETARIARRSGGHVGEVVSRSRTADFQSGRTLLLDGWVVSESEALFCAGLALSAAAAG